MAKITGAMQMLRVIKVLLCFSAIISEVSIRGGGCGWYGGRVSAPVPPVET
jgi:hypothetical protein